MAGELIETLIQNYSKGGVAFNDTFPLVKQAYNSTTGNEFIERTIDLTPTPVALDLGGIVTPGRFKMVNLDSVNTIEIMDSTVGNVCLGMQPGEGSQGRFRCAAPAARTVEGTAQLRYRIFSD